ncbi:hypothetical protein TREES_T100021431 [Tupaia chinensis]|uniref:Uncharacterized protein n=1 Tax=Tupaia chinensis TaxID=246437 RepID=L9L648_TUPCH|nr:hypothetical protein TREES_T100021431 [Tupaia chinensis]
MAVGWPVSRRAPVSRSPPARRVGGKLHGTIHVAYPHTRVVREDIRRHSDGEHCWTQTWRRRVGETLTVQTPVAVTRRVKQVNSPLRTTASTGRTDPSVFLAPSMATRFSREILADGSAYGKAFCGFASGWSVDRGNQINERQTLLRSAIKGRCVCALPGGGSAG